MTEAEFAVLYDQQVRSVRTVLYRMAARTQLDDLTQEVFLRAWRGQAALRQYTSARTWLCRIARHVAIDALRAGRASSIRDDGAVPGDRIAPDIDPSDRAMVLDAFARLPADDRLLLVLLHVEGCTTAEAGEILEVPAGTVKSRAFALRRKLLGLQEEREVLS